jgi:hypothetical protein
MSRFERLLAGDWRKGRRGGMKLRMRTAIENVGCGRGGDEEVDSNSNSD